MLSVFTDFGHNELSVEMSSADSDSGKDSDATYCPTPKRGVGERIGLVQGTAGSTAMLVYVPVVQPVEPPASTEPFVSTKQPESAVSVVSA